MARQNLEPILKKILPQKFFNRQTLKVAQELLGKFLIRKIGRRLISGMITEVEAYIGPEDKASHASRLWRGSPRAARGRTKRTEVMFGKAGYWYIYLVYGMHYCLNIVTEKKNYPAAVLIRSICTNGANVKLPLGVCADCVRGPGRVSKYFKINKKFNTKPADKKTGLYIENRGIKIKPRDISRGKRIGVDYAGKWENRLWRFYLV